MSQTNTDSLPVRANRIDQIEAKIDKDVAGRIEASPALGGVAIRTMADLMEFAKMMAVSEQAVPPYLRGKPGACLAVCIQALEWKMSPYAVANKSYVVNDRLSYESQLIHAVIEQRAPLVGRLRHRYSGDGDERRCTVVGVIKGEDLPFEFQSAPFGKIQPKNSPLWKTKPDLQLYYNASRDWARMYFPDVLMGVYAADELGEAIAVAKPSGVNALLDKVTKRPVSEGMTFEAAPEAVAASNEVPLREIAIRGIEPPEDTIPTTAGDGGTVDAPSRGAPAPDSEAPEHVPAGSEVNAELVRLHEALDDADDAKKNLLARARAVTGQHISKAVFEGALFKALHSRGVGDFAKTTFEQRLELWREIEGGAFPPKT